MFPSACIASNFSNECESDVRRFQCSCRGSWDVNIMQGTMLHPESYKALFQDFHSLVYLNIVVNIWIRKVGIVQIRDFTSAS
jgi:hypothetical protein